MDIHSNMNINVIRDSLKTMIANKEHQLDQWQKILNDPMGVLPDDRIRLQTATQFVEIGLTELRSVLKNVEDYHTQVLRDSEKTGRAFY